MLFYATFRLYNLLVGGLIFLGDCKSPKEWLGHFLTTEYKSVETPNGTFDRTEGRAEGKHEANTETAQRLLAMGLSAEQVAKATQLSLEIIKNLSNS